MKSYNFFHFCRMFHDGIESITVTDIEEKSGLYGISNVIVHENYMADGISDMHDVGKGR